MANSSLTDNSFFISLLLLLALNSSGGGTMSYRRIVVSLSLCKGWWMNSQYMVWNSVQWLAPKSHCQQRLGEKPFLADMCLGIKLLLRRVCLLSASVDKARPSPEWSHLFQLPPVWAELAAKGQDGHGREQHLMWPYTLWALGVIRFLNYSFQWVWF